MQTNGRGIVEDALTKIGALAAGETATAEDANYALGVLNSLVDVWKSERLTINNVERTVFSGFTPGTNGYTMGDGGDIDTGEDPPMKLEGASYLDGEFETTIEVFTHQRWREVGHKPFQSQYPQGVHYIRRAPLAQVEVYPTPSDPAIALVLYWAAAFGGFKDLTTFVTLVSGHQAALQWNLAVWLGPPFGKPPSGEIIAIADNTKATLKRSNTFVPQLRVDEGITGTGSFDIYTGTYRR
jgi:hypothetical protein